MERVPRWLALVAIVGLTTAWLPGCGGDDDGGKDAGVPDAGQDAGPIPDASIPDAGLPDAGPQCVGQARPCGWFGMLACPPVPGCNVTASAVCFTLPSECYVQPNPTACLAVEGCIYNVFLGCEPTYILCDVPVGMECTDVPGCGTGYICEGSATPCDELELATCEDNPGCFVYP